MQKPIGLKNSRGGAEPERSSPSTGDKKKSRMENLYFISIIDQKRIMFIFIIILLNNLYRSFFYML